MCVVLNKDWKSVFSWQQNQVFLKKTKNDVFYTIDWQQEKCMRHRKQVILFIHLPFDSNAQTCKPSTKLVPEFTLQQAWVIVFYIESRVRVKHLHTRTMGRGKTPHEKHPLWNQDMVTRKCLAPNSSIYWIPANIPGSVTLTNPRLGLTSAADQRREKTPVFLLPSIYPPKPALGNTMFIWSNALLWTTARQYVWYFIAAG